MGVIGEQIQGAKKSWSKYRRGQCVAISGNLRESIKRKIVLTLVPHVMKLCRLA